MKTTTKTTAKTTTKTTTKTTSDIATFGVITPVIARKTADERYELISGHRRKRACELLHIDTLPIIVRDLSREEGIILMVDSNLQREHILPSEKAFAYKMKMDAMKRQGQRNDLTSTPVAGKLETADVIGLNNGESGDQVRRYIRLTELIPQLLQMVDEGKIAFRPAVELSYLEKEEQEDLLETIESEDCTPSLAQAIRMKGLSRDNQLNMDKIFEIMTEEKSGTYMTNFNCYGYRKGDDGIPVIVEEEALIIKKIYQLFIDGYSMKQISGILKSEEVKTYSGKLQWEPEHIQRILTNEKYIAVYAFKTNRTEDVVTFDDEKAEVLKEVYRGLNRMGVHTEHITVKETHLETQGNGSVVPVEQEVVKTYLYINTVSLTAEEAANLYGFDAKQREQLGELLLDRNKDMWDALLLQQ